MTGISRIGFPNLILFLFVSADSRYLNFKMLSYDMFNMLVKDEKYMKVLVKKLKGRDRVVDGRIISKWMLKK